MDESTFLFKPIGFVRTDAKSVPRHWTVSTLEGRLEIKKEYLEGLKDIKPKKKIVVIFCFHKSSPYDHSYLRQTPPHTYKKLGVFSTCSPKRPNPVGLSVVEVTGVRESTIYVKNIDIVDGTPILDIKPYVGNKST